MLGMGMGFPNLLEEASPDERIFSCQRHLACDKSPAAKPLPGTCARSAGKALEDAEAAALALIQQTNPLAHD